MAKILVVDDVKEIGELIKVYLEQAGMEVVLAYTGQSALREITAQTVDLIILDLMLPDMNGLELCYSLRRSNPIPVIIVSAKGEELDRVSGLERGADDYVTKPFFPRELVARVLSILRRGGLTPHPEELALGPLRIMRGEGRVIFFDHAALLTPKELDLLWHLASNNGIVFRREELLAQLWGWLNAANTRTVDAHIKRLRHKLDKIGAGKYLRTVWGVGYKFQID
ncbi:MAG: response regulator transcription factor [Peptococcaceae bacterium]|nr:response regulator transcription factor [Peptococcaceae bacterium]